MATDDALLTYRTKRRPADTPEPFSRGARAPGLFVVQMHRATRLHFDLRLELDGTLKSWAVPKGPSLDPSVKRMAIAVEDHPVEYAEFEGLIPPGNYGAGAVVVWDRGVWVPDGDPHKQWAKGHLSFELKGYKLGGRFSLVRLKDGKNWLLIKMKDAWAAAGRKLPPESILSGLTVDELLGQVDKKAEIISALEVAGAPRRVLRPPERSPMLCTPAPRPFTDDEWLFEFKYDGFRLLAERRKESVRLRLRSGLDATCVFPELVTTLERLPFSSFMLDGEVVAVDASGRVDFELLQNRTARPIATTYFAFDLLSVEGFDVRALPLFERKKLLERMLPPRGPVVRSPFILGVGEALFQKVVQTDGEGIVAKRLDSAYRAGRSAAWLKVPRYEREDFVVVGFTPPEGTRKGFGALLLAERQREALRLVGRVGTGFSERVLEQTRRLLEPDVVEEPTAEGAAPKGATWVRPRHLVEVRFKERTRTGLIRQPVFVRFRPDKAPE